MDKTLLSKTLKLFRVKSFSKELDAVVNSLKPTEAILFLIIRFLAFCYTILTLPIFYVIQKPWKVKENRRKPRAIRLMQGEDFVTYRSLREPKDTNIRFVQDKIDTLEKVFRLAMSQHAHKPALGTRRILSEEDELQPNGQIFKKLDLGDYEWRTYADVNRETENFGCGLREIGLKTKENVVIFAETRAEWLISAYGCLIQSMPLVTLYATLGQEALIHGINETEVSCVITSQELLPKFRNILPCTPNVTVLIVMEDAMKPLDLKSYADLNVKILPYREVIRLGAMSNNRTFTTPKGDDTAVIMYTSGSTGMPKGVVMSHQNVLATMLAYSNEFPACKGDTYMAYLPLAHILEFVTETWMCMLFGIPIGYGTTLTMTDKSPKIKQGGRGDVSLVRPAIIVCVPLVLDRIYKSIQEKIDNGPALKKAIFNYAVQYKLDWTERGYDTPIINAVLFKPIRAILGGRARFIVTGGAPLAPDIHKTLRALFCCPVVQGYGLTETCAGTTVMDLEDHTTGTTGGPSTCCDIKLVNWEEGNYRVSDWPNPRGEIHVGGTNVAIGYYQQPERTKEGFYDEHGRHWFRTGDIGEFTPQGFLKIIDRKKDLVKLPYGEYVSLGKVESELKTCPLVDNVCVYADPTKLFVVALILPNPEQLKAFAQRNGVEGASIDDLCSNPHMDVLVLSEIQQHLAKCQRLEKFEVPKAVKLIPEVWTPDSGLVTAALKLKRKNIQDRYQLLIDRMYS